MAVDSVPNEASFLPQPLRHRISSRDRVIAKILFFVIFLPQSSNAVIFGHEIGPVPVNNLHRVFLFRTNIEFVEDHHPLVLEVVQRPFLRLAVGRLLRTEGRIAGFGELDPHFAKGPGEGFVIFCLKLLFS